MNRPGGCFARSFLSVFKPVQTDYLYKPYRVRYGYAKLVALKFVAETALRKPPMPTEELLKHFAVVRFFARPDAHAGYMVPVAGKFYLAVNRFNSPYGRIRFTIAHELGHIRLGHYSEFKPPLSSSEEKILEREADIFAREVLMPEAWMLSEAKRNLDKREIIRLKNLFGVSWEALFIRLEELRLMNRMEASLTLLGF